jgi:hypothetical protein
MAVPVHPPTRSGSSARTPARSLICTFTENASASEVSAIRPMTARYGT